MTNSHCPSENQTFPHYTGTKLLFISFHQHRIFIFVSAAIGRLNSFDSTLTSYMISLRWIFSKVTSHSTWPRLSNASSQCRTLTSVQQFELVYISKQERSISRIAWNLNFQPAEHNVLQNFPSTTCQFIFLSPHFWFSKLVGWTWVDFKSLWKYWAMCKPEDSGRHLEFTF